LKYVGWTKLKLAPNTLLEYALSVPEIPISSGVSELKKTIPVDDIETTNENTEN
jgi:hypothetical protein